MKIGLWRVKSTGQGSARFVKQGRGPETWLCCVSCHNQPAELQKPDCLHAWKSREPRGGGRGGAGTGGWGHAFGSLSLLSCMSLQKKKL